VSEIIDIKKRVGMSPVEQRTGRVLKCGELMSCPFHEETTASFGPYRGTDGLPRWKCQGGSCSWEGDVFDFVEKFDHLPKGGGIKLLRDAKAAPVEAKPAEQAPHKFEYSLPQLERAVGALWQNKPAQDFLAARGITPETAKALTFGFENGRVVMPTFLDGELVAVKLRAINPKDREDKWRKHNRDKNVRYLFNREAVNDFDPVLLIESELDAAMATAHGFTAVSVDGSGHKLTPADIALLKRAPLVILALDNDEAGYKCAAEIEKLIPERQRIRIQLQPGCKDLGELYASAPDSFDTRLRALIRNAQTVRRAFTWGDLLTESEIIEQQGLEIKYVVESLIPEQRITMFFGREKSYKSLFAFYLGKCTANGVRALDNFSVKKMPCLYLDAEDGIIGEYIGWMQNTGNELVRFRTLSTGLPMLDDPALLDVCREMKPLLIVDSLHKFLKDGTGENADAFQSKDMEPVMEKLRTLCVAGATVILIHHSTKANPKEYRDSSAIGAGVDFLFAFEGNFSEGVGRVTVTGLPSRGAQPPTLNLLAFPMLIEHGKFAMENSVPKTDEDLITDFLSQHGKKASYRTILKGVQNMSDERKKVALEKAIENRKVLVTEDGYHGAKMYRVSSLRGARNDGSAEIIVAGAGNDAATINYETPF
jgi:hypothetical protein